MGCGLSALGLLDLEGHAEVLRTQFGLFWRADLVRGRLFDVEDGLVDFRHLRYVCRQLASGLPDLRQVSTPIGGHCHHLDASLAQFGEELLGVAPDLHLRAVPNQHLYFFPSPAI